MEYLKDVPLVFRLDANAVVANREYPVTVLLFNRHVDFRRHILTAILDRIADQVLQHVFDPRVRHERGQLVVGYPRSVLLNCSLQRRRSIGQQSLNIQQSDFAIRMVDLRILQQTLDESSHSQRASADNLHQLDSDPFLVNYVGHPIEGSITGFVFVQNDERYKDAVFGRNRLYWKSRFRAATFSWAYSELFEIGPVSEASIGHTQATYPQQGFVDHVITPAMGLGWMIAEDAVDRMLIERIERHSANRLVRIFARGVLNPSRTMSNLLAARVPWYRQTRGLDGAAFDEVPRNGVKADYPQIPNFEFMTAARVEQVPGAGSRGLCIGGGGVAEFRLRPGWELVGDVGGCKLMSVSSPVTENITGDSLAFMIGPRRVWRQTKRWQPYAQLLTGGRKMAWETVDLAERTAVEAQDPKKKQPSDQALFTQTNDTLSPSILASAGLDWRATRALGIRLGELGYAHSWGAHFDGVDYSNSIQVTMGLTLRWGTW